MQIPEPLAVLRNRNFRIYWIGQAISLVGTWMQIMAQSWVVTNRTTSAAALGALNLAGSLPMLLLGMKAGELADRLDKRKLLLATQVGMMTLAFVFSALVFSGVLALWHVYVLAVAAGMVAAFELPVSQAFAPELVEPAQIPRAVALLQAIFHGGRLVGPALAGVLIDAFGEGAAFAANGFSFLAVILSLLMIVPAARHLDLGTKKRGGFREGLDYVKRDAVMGSLLALLALSMAFVFPFLAVLMVYYARHVLQVEAAGMGSIMSASGFGALVGAVILMSTPTDTWRARLNVGVVAMGACLIALAFNRDLSIAIALVGVNAVGTSMVMGTTMQTAQQRVPGELRGRVMALFGMVFTSVLPFAAIALSALADVVGLTRLMAVSGIVYLVAGGVVLGRLRRIVQ